jgi:hypothetical protein
MTHKLKISKPGYNVLTEINPDNLIFSSDYNTLKYETSGAVSVNYVQDPSAVTYYFGSIKHNLGYIPVFYVFVNKDTDLNSYYEPCPFYYGSFVMKRNFYAYATTTHIYFVCQMYYSYGSGITNKNASFRYFIFKNNTGL